MKKVFKLLLQLAPYVAFVVLAGRIAFTREFPLPFDESFHFGVINFYAHHLNPFFAQQPASANAYGALARDPSYLYHYLMSFPLRALIGLHATLAEQVWTLRAFSIGFGLSSLYLITRLAKQLGLPTIAGYGAALGLAVTPVFYDVNAQINYDALLIPLTLLTVLLTLQVGEQLRQQRLQPSRAIILSGVVLLSSLVVYSYLPILLAVVLYLGYQLWRCRSYRLLRNFVIDTRSLKRVTQVALVAFILLSGGLWVQRYGVNLARYHTPHPQCNAVLSVQQCLSYGPWARNYQLHQVALTRPMMVGPATIKYFTHLWLGTMYKEIFTILSISRTNTLIFSLQITALAIGSAFIGVAILLAALLSRQWRRVTAAWTFAALATGLYLSLLWIQNFSDFHNLGQLVAVQGRYLLPVLPLAYLAISGLWMNGLTSVARTSEQFGRDLLPVGLSYGLRVRNQLLVQLPTFSSLFLQLRAVISTGNTGKSYTLFLR